MSNIYRKTLKYLWNQSTKNELKYSSIKRIADKNEEIQKTAKKLLSAFDKLRNFNTDLEDMDTKLVNEEIKYLYKQWDVELLSTEEENLEYMASILIPLITYNIIYEEPKENDLGFYSSGLELRDNFFYEFKETELILHASVVLEKNFDTVELIVPKVKLLVDVDRGFLEMR